MINLLVNFRAFAVDLDGVMWEGERLLPGARELLRHSRDAGKRVAFLTNTVSLSRRGVIDKFRRLGIDDVDESQVFSAGRAAGLFIARKKPGARVFVLGMEGTIDEMRSCGLVPVDRGAEFVMIGVDREVTYERLKLACREALGGAELVAANPDRSYPVEDGPVPGCGCFKAFVECCAGREAIVVGKPNPEIFRQAIEHLGVSPAEALMIGDNAEVDLVGARAAGMPCVLVSADGPYRNLADLLDG